MNGMVDKVLTRIQVEKLGFDKLLVITADMLDGYTSIGNHAFESCSNLTSITIPDSVTIIGLYAFRGCSSLTSVTIPNSVTSIGIYAFRDCSGLTSVTIPNSVTSIGGWAFSWCSGLTSVTIGNSVTSIGDHAFGGCSSLTYVTIGNSVTNIGDSAFIGCSSLTSITIPNSVTKIGCGAFAYCRGLTSIEIPNSVTSVGEEAFSHCKLRQKMKTDKQGRVVAYKGFTSNLTCRGFQYKEGETYEIEEEPKLCERGFHACINPLDCFCYYYGQIGIDVVFHKVYLEGVSDEKGRDSKVASNKITIGREITPFEMADIASGRK